jgi:N-glycosidase YbiA
MEERLINVLSRVPKEILIHCAEILIFNKKRKMTSQSSSKQWIRFYDPKAEYFEFSNFYKHKTPLVIDGEKYKTTEHYFQAQKYDNDMADNREYAKLIKSQNTAGQAKMLANPIKKARWEWEKKLKEVREEYEDRIVFDPVEWNAKRDAVMLKALMAKFTQDQHCKKVLLSTGDAVLSEHTPRDHYWGSGGDPNKIGRLGELLMEVRDQIKGPN